MLWIKNKATQKMLNIKVLRPSKHYFPWDIMIFGRKGYEGHTFISAAYNNEEGIIWNIKDNMNNYVLLSTHFYFIIMGK
jgi:hypothetical protein